MEKRFFETQGKNSSRGTQQCGMARSTVDLNLAVDKWEIGGQVGDRSTLMVSARLYPCSGALPEKS